ncbi:MAG: PilW family protein [Candidatus Methylomirabilota bacterium]
MIKSMSSRRPGFSLVELVIGLTVFLVVLLAVYQLFDTGTATYRSGQRKVDVQQNARVALDEVVRQIRMVGYWPENFDANPANDLPATSIGLHVGMSNGLAVFGDLDGTCNLTQAQNPGQSCPAPSSNVFLFCVDTDKPNRKVYIRRGRGPTGNDNSYTCSQGDILAELADLTFRRDSDTIIDNTAWLTFTYYDANNALIPVPGVAPKGLDSEGLSKAPAFGSTTNRRNVRTVVITLVAREDAAHQDPQIYSLTSSVRLRNVN